MIGDGDDVGCEGWRYYSNDSASSRINRDRILSDNSAGNYKIEEMGGRNGEFVFFRGLLL